MRNALIRWLSGDPPAIVGAWVSNSEVCLVQMAQAAVASHENTSLIYEPCGQVSEGYGTASSRSAEVVNALRCAVEKLGPGTFALALGIPSGDIFTKTIEIPLGLNEKQVGQISVVEAVSNLPVPPEEICADFLRLPIDSLHPNEQINIAFCKREVIDQLTVVTEDAGVHLAIVDRDLQAIHDASLWCLARAFGDITVTYPLGLLLKGNDPKFLICRSDLDITSYELAEQSIAPNVGLGSEALGVYCRRAGLAEGVHGYLKWCLIVDEGQESGKEPSEFESLAEIVRTIRPRMTLGGASQVVPLTGLMVALGMALRPRP